ncbi:MAG: N-acetylmuramoyl-L-alanine amidase [Candidatus Manganitrophaceae bacterium]|nr:MAG: N-acetylmuramoyl-L-alanine amidase [Candidatus Manganitrophaceae bacterium]
MRHFFRPIRPFLQLNRFVSLALVFCITLAAMRTTSPAVAAEELKPADACRDSLKASPERKKVRANWEKCIRKYKETRAFKQNDGHALLDVARLYQELYLYSNQADDLLIAKGHYQKIAQESPRSSAGKEAQRQINRIETVLGATPASEATVLSNIRHWAYPDYTRVVIDLNRPPSFQVEKSSSTSLSVRLSETVLGDLFKKNRTIVVRDGLLKQIEAKQKERDAVDIVLTFNKLGSYKAIPLTDPDRLVIDLSNGKEETPAAGADTEKPSPRSDVAALLPPPPPFTIKTIVIDPGHGGKDPGALGVNGLEEKEVVLDVSLRLKELIEKKLKKKVIMTRDQDVFIPLDERTLMANAQKADLFVSVHANSSPRRSTQGIEVYFLGRASDDRAIEVAARENATSQKAARDFQEVILNDLERDFNMNESLEFAHLTQNAFVEQLLSKYPTASLGVKRAPFYVLANTNMPAILAEISFLTNPAEEKRLRSSPYRQKIAESLLRGIERYLDSIKVNS